MAAPVLTKNGDKLELDLSACRGGEFQDTLAKIREVPGRTFDFERKLWVVPAEAQVADRVMKSIRPQADEDLLNWLKESMISSEEALLNPIPDDAKVLVPWGDKRCSWQPEKVNDEEFNGLLPYQRAGVAAMVEPETASDFPDQVVARAILGDDMGLGKTLQAISAVEEFRLRNVQDDGVTMPEGPKLVICPNSVKGGWARELRRWLPSDTEVVVIDGKLSAAKRKQQLEDAIKADAWIIINWEQLRIEKKKVKTRTGGTKTVKQIKEPLLENTPWLAVIADEVHKAKNYKALQTQGLWRVRGLLMCGLTGTALMNSPDELWSILRWLWPDEFHDQGRKHKPGAMAYWPFYNMYVDFYEDHYNRKIVTGVKNPDALRFLLTGKLIRRTAAILGLKGRKRIFYDVPLNPKQQKLYDEAEKAMWLEIVADAKSGDRDARSLITRIQAGETIDASTMLRIPNGAARMVRCQQIIESPALLGGPDDSALLDDVEEKVDASRPSQWVVFVKYKGTCELLATRLRKQGLEVGVYNGDVDPEDRTALEDAFQRGEIDVMVGTIAAMYQGITLTAAHLQHWVTRDFVPAINEQGESREDRLGQQEQVRVYIPQALNTVADNKIQPANRLKEGIVASVLPKDKIEEEYK